MTLQQYMMYIYKWNPNRATIIIDARTRERISWDDLPDYMNRISCISIRTSLQLLYI